MRTGRLLANSVALGAIVVTCGCATGPNRKAEDPLEPMNRAVFSFNDYLDKYIAHPAAAGYQKVTPAPVRTAVRNVFSNVGDIGNLANDLLQLKVTDATEDLVRFAFNSTFGIGGLIDWATAAGLPKHHQDFGLTLGHYGVPAGPYLVLPLFGPSSIRDATIWIAAYPTAPTSYISWEYGVPLFSLQFVSERADMLGATDILSQAALDRYAFVRDAYRQRREYLLRGGNSALPDYSGDHLGTASQPPATPALGDAARHDQPHTNDRRTDLPTYVEPGIASPYD